MSTKEFEVSLPPLPAHSFHFPFSKNHPLKENRRRCSAFGLSQQLGAYSGSCKLQFFSRVKPAHTPTYPSTSVYCGDYGLLTTLTALRVEEASSLGHLCSEVYIENSLFWKCSLPLAACLVEPALLVVSLCPPARPFLGPRLLIRKSLSRCFEKHM